MNRSLHKTYYIYNLNQILDFLKKMVLLNELLVVGEL